MRGLAGTALALLLASLLAGCSQEPSPAPADGAAPAPALETRTWARDDYLSRDGGCTPGPVPFCSSGFEPRTVLFAPNERLVAVDIAVMGNGTAPGDSGDPVLLSIRCIELDEPCQANATVEETSPLPVRLRADGLGWPWGAGLRLDFKRAADPVKYWTDGVPSHPVRVEATFTVEVDRSRPAPPLEEVRTPFSYDATTGMCVLLVEPDCPSGPWRTLHPGTVRGTLVHVWANATWDAVSPTAETLRFSVSCSYDRVRCDGFPIEFEGPSPLAIDTGDLSVLRIPEGAAVTIGVHESAVEPTPGYTALTRQPFHLEGEFLSVVRVDEG